MNTDTKILLIKKKPNQVILYLEAKQDEIITLVEMGYTVSEICEYLGVKDRTFYKFLKTQNEDYVTRYRMARFKPNLEVEAATFKAAKGYEVVEEELIYIPGVNGEKTKVKAVKKTTKHIPPNPTLNIWWNKNRNPGRWADKITVDHTLNKESAKKAILELFVGNQIEDGKENIMEADFTAIPESTGNEEESV